MAVEESNEEVTEEISEHEEDTSLADELSAQWDAATEEATPEVDKSTEAEEDSKPEDTPPAESEESTEVEATPELPPINPPQSMSQEDHERFHALPREQQEFVASQYKNLLGDYTRKTQELAQRRKSYDDIEQAIAPYRQNWDVNGISPGAKIRQNLAVEEMFAQDFPNAVAFVAQNVGYDLSKLVDDLQSPTSPQVQQLTEQVNGLQNQIQRQQTQAQYDHVRVGVQAEVDNFRNAVDGEGQKLYPHADVVEKEMSYLMPMVQQANPQMPLQEQLKTAYEQAIYANSNVRAQIQKQAQEAQELARKKASEEKVRKADLASTSVTGAPGGSSSNAQPKDSSIRGILEHNWDSTSRL